MALAVFAFGCPPPFNVDLMNNTDATITIHAPDGPVVLASGESVRKNWRRLVQSRPDPHSNLIYSGLEIEANGRVVEYSLYFTMDREWLDGRDVFVQFDEDLAIRIVKPGDNRPVSERYSQPEGWPLRPVEANR